VQRHPDLGDTFREGEEVEAWDDLPELTEKARYYVDHPSEALAIAQRGHARCLASHTWQHRFEEILNVLA